MGNKQNIVAVDAGHADVKALLYQYDLEDGIENGRLSPITSAPAIVGMGEAVDRMSSNGQHKPDEIRFGGKNYMTGNYVDKYAKKTISRQDISRFIQGDEILVNMYRAWGALGLGATEESTIYTGTAFPITVFIDDKDGKKKEKYCLGLKKRLEGTHEFLFNGQRHRVNVAEAFTLLQQPTCALFDLSHNQLFQPLKNSQFNLRSGTIVIDGGGHTVDIYTQMGNEVVPKLCGVKEIGLNRSREHLIQELQAIKHVTIPPVESDRLMRAYSNGETVETLIKNYTDVTPIVEQVVDTYISDVMDFVLPLIRDESSRYNIVLVGGLAHYIGDIMKNEFPPNEETGDNVYIPQQPEYAVVRGLSKVLTGYYGKKAAKRARSAR